MAHVVGKFKIHSKSLIGPKMKVERYELKIGNVTAIDSLKSDDQVVIDEKSVENTENSGGFYSRLTRSLFILSKLIRIIGTLAIPHVFLASYWVYSPICHRIKYQRRIAGKCRKIFTTVFLFWWKIALRDVQKLQLYKYNHN